MSDRSPKTPSVPALPDILQQVASNPDKLKQLAAETREEISRDSERGGALSAVARLDALLADALRRRMVDDDEAASQMFSENGSLFSFGAKVRFGYLFGLYNKEVFEELVRINKIRNDFAHKRDATGFAWDRIRSISLNLKMPEIYEKQHGYELIAALTGLAKTVQPTLPEKMNAEARFQLSVLLLAIVIRGHSE